MKANKKIVAIGTIGFLITMQAISFGKYLVDDFHDCKRNCNIQIESLNKKKVADVNNLKDKEFIFLTNVLNNNLEKADMLSSNIKKDIRADLLKEYSNLDDLHKDIMIPSNNTRFANILNKRMKGKYLNVNNDNNDPWAAVIFNNEKNKNYITFDKSFNCSINSKEIRDFKKEVSVHSNKPLASEALEAISNHSNEIIFWQFLNPTNNNLLVKSMTTNSIKENFFKNGIEVFKTLEFLVPQYIDNDADIFGTDHINNLGQKNNSIAIVIVQGFNLYDAISNNKNTAESVAKYEQSIQKIEYDNNVEVNKIIEATHAKVLSITRLAFLLIVLWLVIFVSVVYIQNSLVEDVLK